MTIVQQREHVHRSLIKSRKLTALRFRVHLLERDAQPQPFITGTLGLGKPCFDFDGGGTFERPHSYPT